MYRLLTHRNKKYQTKETMENLLHIIPYKRVYVRKLEEKQNLNQLYVPVAKNYTAFDAWIPGVGAFQATVSLKHDIKGQSKLELNKLGENATKLYWLLPPDNYEKFVKKEPKDIDQYAVLIDYPSIITVSNKE